MRPALLVLAASLLAIPAAGASRAPTAAERSAIRFTVRYFPAIGRQNVIRFTRLGVSTADPRYASAVFMLSDAHGGSLGDFAAVLRHATSWKVIDFGEAPLACANVPPEVRDDLGMATCRGRPKP